MKEYPEPNDRWLDVIETLIACAIAGLLCVCVYFTLYFAAIILEVAK